jgi:prepilin-type N-terminal cleavage/methylation domain-containing protein
MQGRPLPRHVHGFTLLEVLVALSVFALSALMLTQTFSNALLCKINFEKGGAPSLQLQGIREALMRLSRDAVEKTQVLYEPGNKQQIRWQGKVQFSLRPNLFYVDVRVQGSRQTERFFVYRSDWMTTAEADRVLKVSRNETIAL